MNRRRSNAGLALFSVLSLAAAAAIVTYSVSVDLRPSSTLPWACLPVLVLAVAAAQAFQVDVTGPTSPARFTLVTATVAPLIYGYGIATVAAAVALGHLPGMFGGSLRRMRGLTLMARWTFSATVGATVAELLGVATELTPAVAASIVLSLAVISVVNLGWLLVEAAITDPASWPYAIRKPVFLAAVIAVHWVVNSLFGLLFVFALAGSPLGVLLVPVPLLLIFVTARLYTDAYADRGRVETLSEASRILSEPVDPMTAIRPFLEEIRERFGARTAALVMVSEDHRPTAFRWSADGTYEDEVPVNPLERRLVKSGVLTRVSASDNSALARLLREDGRRSCVAAPMQLGTRIVGVIVLYDLQGPTPSAERYQVSVLETLARQTVHTLSRGWAISKVVQNERSLAEILRSTSDGIFTLDASGAMTTWNPACERISGLPVAEVRGRRDALARLHARTASGRPVDLLNWREVDEFPREMLITATNGEQRQLACSFTRAENSDGTRSLVVIARDITPATEFHELSEQFKKLVEMQAAQRLVVDHLQQAVAPEPPGMEGVDIAVAYVASDPTAPTGGDLFDWHELPTGELHVAVVDVLGHGVTATRDALSVIHTLRHVAVEGTPLEEVVARADMLLGAQDSELVATVVVARYHPCTGELRVASGGHPPALIVAPDGGVRQVAGSGGAIGWPGVGSHDIAVTRLEEGESLILYTDGLVEARRDIIAGMEQLELIAGEIARLPAQELSDTLVQRSLEGAERHDDALALVVRRASKPALAPSARWELTPQATYLLSRVRREMREWMSAHEIVSEDALLVADELLANALDAARTRAVLAVEVSGRTLTIEATDDGTGDPHLDEHGRTRPPDGRERGRGLYIVRRLSREVRALSTADGSVVRAQVVAGPRADASLG